MSRALRWAAGLLLAGTAAWAQSPPPDRTAPLQVRPPPPLIIAPGATQPIQLRAVTIATEVLGDQAQTRYELRLFNPNGRQLEGELQFPLLEGQVVTGFALDVGGRLRDAVPVPKARGQEIFEDIRRRRVDPGLLEATASNQYKLRVYPLPPQGERKVQLTVTETLARMQGRWQLRMPLAFGAAAGALDVRVRVNGLEPKEVRVVQAAGGVQVVREPTATTIELHRQNWTARHASDGLLVSLPGAAGAQVMSGEGPSGRFFAAHVPVPATAVRHPDPSRVALVWDASGSAASQQRALPVLDAWFRQLRHPVKVSLLVVRNRVEAAREFEVQGGRWDALRDALQAEPFDGSSNFDALPIPADAQLTLFVSDGLATDGRRQIRYAHAAPLFAINAAAVADVPRLTRLAERSGGAYVDAYSQPPLQAARVLLEQGWRIERLASLQADQLVAQALRPVDGRIAIAGRMTERTARIEVTLVNALGARRTVTVDIGAGPDAGRWPGQQWAQWRGAELGAEPGLHQAEMRRIAAEHGLIGANQSLIVLEAAADYARYDLPAPPDLVAEVQQLRAQNVARADEQRRAFIESVVRQFEERQQWWDKPFPKDTPPARAAAAVGEQLAGRQRESAAQPMAAPGPAHMSAPAQLAAPARMTEAAKSSDSGASRPPQSTIALQPWTPDVPYLRRLQQAAPADLYRVYLDERESHRDSSAFFMDVASFFFDRHEDAIALRVLSNLAEMNLENRQLLRLYGYRLTQAGRNDLAVPVFERVRDLAPDEPQSWRDLGLALAEIGKSQEAVDALWQVVSRPSRFAGMNMIALAELNAIAARAQAAGQTIDLSRVDPRLRRNLPLQLRVVLAWDTDDTDIDLWVTDPNRERANYAHRLTYQGGAMSPDATGGYGPEEFALREAKPGTYVIEAQFFGHRQQVLSAGTTVMARVTTDFGTPQARDQWLTLRLTSGRETVRVGEVVVGGDRKAP